MIQAKLEKIGLWGCYFLCLRELGLRAGATIQDVLELYDVAVQRQWMREDCYLVRPEKILEYMTQRVWRVWKKPADYVAKEGELEVLHWYWKNPANGKETWHFTLPDFDPYGESLTRKNGIVTSKRIFMVI